MAAGTRANAVSARAGRHGPRHNISLAGSMANADWLFCQGARAKLLKANARTPRHRPAVGAMPPLFRSTSDDRTSPAAWLASAMRAGRRSNRLLSPLLSLRRPSRYPARHLLYQRHRSGVCPVHISARLTMTREQDNDRRVLPELETKGIDA